MFLKALNMSDPAPGPESTSTPVPVDGALVETRDLGYTHCDLWEDANGNPLITYSTQSYKVRKNMDKIRARSDKPKTLPDVSPLRILKIMVFDTEVGSHLLTHAKGNCERVICEDNSGIVWCANITVGLQVTHKSLRHPSPPPKKKEEKGLILPSNGTSC